MTCLDFPLSAGLADKSCAWSIPRTFGSVDTFLVLLTGLEYVSGHCVGICMLLPPLEKVKANPVAENMLHSASRPHRQRQSATTTYLSLVLLRGLLLLSRLK